MRTFLTSLGTRLLEKILLFLRRFKPVRERVVLGEFNDYVEREHVARYQWATQYCVGKSIADIACGSGYGMEILRGTCSSVDGYDQDLLCSNIVIDLEKEGWSRPYDVIVSFETIEHLANPDFFLENIHRSAPLLVVSAPIGELKGYNPYHKQVWREQEFRSLLERWFECQYFYQRGESISGTPSPRYDFLLALATRKGA